MLRVRLRTGNSKQPLGFVARPLWGGRALLGQVAGGRSQVEQLGKVRSDVRVIRLVNEQAGGGAGLQSGADAVLEWLNMAHVPAVGGHLQIVGVENRDLDAAVLDPRAPVRARRAPIRGCARVAGEVVDGLFETATG